MIVVELVGPASGGCGGGSFASENRSKGGGD
jgi:hypothetical protein